MAMLRHKILLWHTIAVQKNQVITACGGHPPVAGLACGESSVWVPYMGEPLTLGQLPGLWRIQDGLPVFVPGAIAASAAASAMNVPAEAARAPAGETKTITGRLEAFIDLMIWRIELSSPPVVSSSMTTATARSVSAREMPRLR